ncbi:type I polyketide synthase [Moorena sp. SIO4G3]|uniref:type I polyketide synthase n=1 Tax=Moorena sp. SIO4G3 TaxID=2607821 RepID=UPI00142C3EA0|nr:type I polyketide synthase [Moorena sp. SIO4G3]NEO76846.1 type I polyketide synthase [Moorena sp. SIO4G3]
MKESKSSRTVNYKALMENAFRQIETLQSQVETFENKKIEPIAIIGMSCRFPGGVDSPEAFWQLLNDGVDAISEVPLARWNIDDYYDPDPDAPGKICTRDGGFLSQIDGFDTAFFGISPREAHSLDPQQRLLLEVSWEAIERANIVPDKLFNSLTGVFIGIAGSDYSHRLVTSEIPEAYWGTGNASSAATGRLSYILGLTGPNLAVETACSSSLVSVHLACQSLRQRECNMALTGGVNLLLSPESSIVYSQAKMLSTDGRCKTFDASANGYVRGEGCGIIVLKRLSDAVANGDNILAVIRGTAVNQDGQSGGLTVPNGPSQVAVIRQALANGAVDPADVSYIEAHGTGTSLGDPIEVGAIGTVFGSNHSVEHPVIIGSAKTNIGHLEVAAGIAGLMKVVLQLQQQKIAPSLHFNQPNPYINWSQLPLQVSTQLTPWPTNGKSRIAGVSSFGFSGTNAHAILEEAPIQVRSQKSEVGSEDIAERPIHILTLSAKTQTALGELVSSYHNYLKTHPELKVADICHTANTGRAQFHHRLAVVASNQQELVEKLRQHQEGEEVGGIYSGKLTNNTTVPKIAFLFTGQGSQYVNMGRQLYQQAPTFREAIHQCDEILSAVETFQEKSLREILYPTDKDESGSSLLEQTAYTQPVLFALEYALFKLWQSWGIKPNVVMGHSVGEYVAATVAGVFNLEDGLKLIAARGRLMQQLPSGGEMVSVMTSESKVRETLTAMTLGNKVAIAAINGPESVVISGESLAVRAIATNLESVGIKTKQLQVSHAFHSPLMEPMLAEFEAVANQLTYHQPKVPIISNVTGTKADNSIATAQYWVSHVRQPVRFAQGIKELNQQGYETFLEIGPKPILLGMGRQCLSEGAGLWLASLRPGVEEWQQMLSSLGQLHVQGAKVDWLGFDQDYAREKVALPTYPFQRQRYWVENCQGRDKTTKQLSAKGSSPVTELLDQGDYKQLTAMLSGHGSLTAVEVVQQLIDHHQKALTQAALKDCLYQIEWQLKPSALAPESPSQVGQWLIIEGEETVAQKLAEQLQHQGHSCYLLEKSPLDYLQILQQVQEETEQPLLGIIYLTRKEVPSQAETTCQSLLGLIQALVQQDNPTPAKVWVVTAGAVALGEHPISVAQTPVWGMGKVASLEHPELWGGLIDLEPDETAEAGITCLLRELLNPDAEDQVVYRKGERYVPRLVSSSPSTSKKFKVEPTGSYLITGGLGSLGLKVANWLVQQGARHLLLFSRKGLTEKVKPAVEALQKAGAKVSVIAADVAEQTDMERVWQQMQAEGNPLKGIVHAAGVAGGLDFIEELTPEAWEEMLRPKVKGGWNLHQLCEKENLDFFVCFSSIASVWGSKGQAHYAAANQFLDGLMHYRNSLGLPGLAINWGPWAGGGMATDEAQEWLAQIGIEALSPELAISALEQLLSADEVQVTVSRNDWSRFKTMYALKRPRPFLELIATVTEEVETKTDIAPSLRQQLEAVTETQRRKVLQQALQEEVAQVLGLPITNKPDPEVGFFEMGMDSLMAVELQNRLSKLLGVNLSSTLIFDFPNIEKLEKYIINQYLAKIDLFKTETDQDEQEGEIVEANLLTEIKESSNQELESSIDKILESIIN